MRKQDIIISALQSINKYYLVITLLFFTCPAAYAAGYLQIVDGGICNSEGQKVTLRGIGLGGWLAPEGYMLQMSDFANSPTEIRRKIEDLIGAQKTDEFFIKYRANFVTRSDIEYIAGLGFNSVRLPLHYSLFSGANAAAGFRYIDSLLQQCADNHLYLFLEMHCAPGGQNNRGTSDYDSTAPSLWQSSANQSAAINIWRSIASRYSSSQWIGGYDLLNEPNWDLGSSNEQLRDFYINATNEIRAVDNNHIIFIEGNNFATNFTGLLSPWDEKIVYSFHKYWDSTSTASIEPYLDLRTQTGQPLWMGESGENNNVWYTNCVKLLEENSIGWSWWTLKKLESVSGLFSVSKPAEFETLLQYWKGNGSKPSVEYSIEALNKLTESLLFVNCRKNADVSDALIRQASSSVTLPYSVNNIPGIIYAVNYDFGKAGSAYGDEEYANNGGKYRNDGVDIEICSDAQSNGYNIGWIANNEYLTYTVTVAQSGTYSVRLRVASPGSSGQVQLSIDNGAICSTISVPSSGGYTNWSDVTVPAVNLTKGTHTLKVAFPVGGFNFNRLTFENLSEVTVDGIINESEYETLASWTGAANWSPSNQLGAIKYHTDGKKIYLGITGKVEQNWNKILLVVNFSGYNGIPENNPNPLPSGFNTFYQNLAGTQMGIESDFIFTWTCDSNSPLYCDAQRYGTNNAINGANIGSSNQSGTPSVFSASGVQSCLGGSTGGFIQAYRNDFDRTTAGDHGLELAMDISCFSGVTNTQNVSFFVIISGSNGDWLSNQTLPDYYNTGLFGGDFGNDPNISWLAWNARTNQSHPEVYFHTTPKALLKDIWINVTAIPEGLYNGSSNKLARKDTLQVVLANASSPFSAIDTAVTIIDSISFTGLAVFKNAPSANYYIVLKTKNTVETWSKNGGETIAKGEPYSYSFTTSSAQAYQQNLKSINGRYCLYSGDVNQDGKIDFGDITQVEYYSRIYNKGYISSDINGDGTVDFSDIMLVDNNAFLQIERKRP